MKLYWFFVDVLHQPLYNASKQFSEIYLAVPNQIDLMSQYNNREYPGVENINIDGIDQLNAAFESLGTN